LKFCINTFRWGDYIHEVWDSWYLDQRGVLLVAEITPKEIDTNDEKLIKTAGSPENRLSSVTNQVVVGGISCLRLSKGEADMA
jgi:hypothetical protein